MKRVIGGIAAALLLLLAATARGGEATKPPALATGGLTKVGTVPVAGKAHDIALAGEKAYVASSEGVTVLDISDPAAPRTLGSLACGSSNYGVIVSGNLVFLASKMAERKGRLLVVDVANPATPKLVGFAEAPAAYDVAVKENVVYVLSWGGMLRLFDVSTPAAPKEVRTIRLIAWRPPGYHKGVTEAQEAENLRLLASGENSRPSGSTTGLALEGNNLFACDWVYGRVYYYDVSNAASPVFKGTNFSSYLLRMAVRGDDLYLLGAYASLSGLYHVKVSALSPTKPTRLTREMNSPEFLPSKYGIDMGGIGIAESGKYVFYCGGKGDGEFHVVDVSNGPPQDVACATIGPHRCKMPEPMDLASRGEYIYLCGGETGLQVWRFPGLADGAPAVPAPAAPPAAPAVPAATPAAGIRGLLEDYGKQATGGQDGAPAAASANAYQGFGASTPGGAGQTVYHVTNLKDSGAGSLRDGVSTGNRMVLFDVAGTITLSTHLYVRGAFVTLDGLSAPAPGITLNNYGLILRGSAGAHDVIVRGIRVRNAAIDGFQVAYRAYNIVLDHCSVWNSADGNIDITENSHDVTVSWCLIAAPNPAHPMNMLVKYNPSRVTLHHNVFVKANQRNPQVRIDDAGTRATDTTADVRNNLIWDWGPGYGTLIWHGPRANVVNNFYQSPSSSGSKKKNGIQVDKATASAYVAGNVSGDGASITSYFNSLGNASAPFPAPAVDTTDADTAARAVYAGAGVRPLDATDQDCLALITLASGGGATPALVPTPTPPPAAATAKPAASPVPSSH